MVDTKPAGRTVLVTGAGGGIGAAIARAFSAEGARVAVHHYTGTPAPPGVTWEHATVTTDAVVFLASHQARWITGQVLQVAGGHAL